LSVAELARLAKVSTATITRIEAGRSTGIRALEAVARALGVELVFRTPPQGRTQGRARTERPGVHASIGRASACRSCDARDVKARRGTRTVRISAARATQTPTH
jgi:transcriptional regulator with XRE-family HTH domain